MPQSCGSGRVSTSLTSECGSRSICKPSHRMVKTIPLFFEFLPNPQRRAATKTALISQLPLQLPVLAMKRPASTSILTSSKRLSIAWIWYGQHDDLVQTSTRNLVDLASHRDMNFRLHVLMVDTSHLLCGTVHGGRKGIWAGKLPRPPDLVAPATTGSWEEYIGVIRGGPFSFTVELPWIPAALNITDRMVRTVMLRYNRGNGSLNPL